MKKFLDVIKNKAFMAGMAVTALSTNAYAVEDTTTASTPLTDMVEAIDLSDTTTAIISAAGVLLGLGVLIYGAKKVICFFGAR